MKYQKTRRASTASIASSRHNIRRAQAARTGNHYPRQVGKVRPLRRR